jgi:hypothetical protein
VFEAVCKGGKKTAVAQLMTITCFTRVKVLQLGGRLADQQLVHKTKRDGQTAHAKDRYLAAKDSSRHVFSYPKRDLGIRTKRNGWRYGVGKKAAVRMRARQPNFLRAPVRKRGAALFPVEANKLTGINRLPVWC